ncbi:hypothetical protein [Mycobacterium szulgai]|uniref:Uncharacterized protein n=1 Tax=Mycobacterium szulgai TaxID=1787 RepID=A0A1X2DKQ1_MYCSZ|nr:hypothetical protein [Mycobacterium szulgai]MCV7076983.1 hypothetical protein [Mycobacterium szulgai]ORW88797.1 hypothetical protein AWC27_13945 [Mycobacterium szulgai]
MPIELRRVPNLELLKVGRWDGLGGEFDITAEHLASAVEAHQAGVIRKAVIRLGHTGMGDASPALGYVDRLRLADGGMTLVGDLAGVPKAIATLIPRAWPDRSIEGLMEYEDPNTGRTWPFVLTALALIGATRPAVSTLRSLQDVAELYGLDVAAAQRGRSVSIAASAFHSPDDAARARAVQVARARRRRTNQTIGV